MGRDKNVSNGVNFVIINLFDGIDVVISAVPEPSIPKQHPLLEVPKASGVQLFVPAEFGSPR
jgi:hypothetical protein